LHERLAAWTRDQQVDAVVARLQRHGVAAAPVLCVADLLADPQLRARETFAELRHPLGYPVTLYNPYVRTSGARAELRPGPRLGQDNERVFRGLLGLPEAEYRRLVEEQVIH
jgi:benzylsuccinate CoA-transferase BbsF subunit